LGIIRHKYEKNIKIIVDNCKGAAKCGELYAIENGIPYEVYSTVPKHCTRKSNLDNREKFIKENDALVLFWDYESSESEDLIYLAVRYNLYLFIMLYKTKEFYAGQNAIDKIYDTILPF
jgi:hypothetical protein